MEKIAILRNNRLEAIVISTNEYERLKALEDQIERMEEKRIYDLVQERNRTPLSEYDTIDELADGVASSSPVK